jgi:hypothetical protein
MGSFFLNWLVFLMGLYFQLTGVKVTCGKKITLRPGRLSREGPAEVFWPKVGRPTQAKLRSDPERFVRGHIQVDQSRCLQDIAPSVPEGVLGVGNECRRVEPPLNGWIGQVPGARHVRSVVVAGVALRPGIVPTTTASSVPFPNTYMAARMEKNS